MVKVIALKCGYYGGKIREIGEEFELADNHWQDEKARPSWVKVTGELSQETEEPVKASVSKKGKKKVTDEMPSADTGDEALPDGKGDGSPVEDETDPSGQEA